MTTCKLIALIRLELMGIEPQDLTKAEQNIIRHLHRWEKDNGLRDELTDLEIDRDEAEKEEKVRILSLKHGYLKG